MKYGLYSAKDANQRGYTVWKTPDGREVNITCASSTPEGIGYEWPDKVLVGEVVSYVRSVKSDLNKAFGEFEDFRERNM